MPLMNKHSLDELEIHVLNGDIYGKESKGFSSCCNDDARLSETNHIQYVKIFVLQLGSKEQHGEILELLEDFQERDFRNGKIAYRRAENTPHTNSITQVARLVNEQIGGLHHIDVLHRVQHKGAGATQSAPPCGPSPTAQAALVAQQAMLVLEGKQLLHLPRNNTLELIKTRTRLLDDYVRDKKLVGDFQAADSMGRGEAALLPLFDRPQGRTDLGTLVVAALRDVGHLLAFTAAEFLLDRELEVKLDEGRADAYLIVEDGETITHSAYKSVESYIESRIAFFKLAVMDGRVLGICIKSDFGLRNQRSTSGEPLHADHCPIVLWALPRVNTAGNAMSDVMVYANVHQNGRIQVTGEGQICVVGPALAYPLGSLMTTDADSGQRALETIDEVRGSLEVIEEKLQEKHWHRLVLFSMGASQLPVHGVGSHGTKRARAESGR
mmetsp:Transcript_27858/g.47645  ORF Transcript_27858/g.47645 Transcript_27858/m.47645 type:complete len:439 (+) Transcript_27858:66-1382(+)